MDKETRKYYVKKAVNYISLGMAILLMFPTIAILVTWETLPGDKLYPLKRQLESVALAVVGGSDKAEADLYVQLVDRRYKETSELLMTSSDLGLVELKKEVNLAKIDIVEWATRGEDEESIGETADKFITQLERYDRELEQQKQELVVASVFIVSGAEALKQSGLEETEGEQDIIISSGNNANIVNSVSEVQEEIQEAIEELKEAKEPGWQGDANKNENANKDKQKQK